MQLCGPMACVTLSAPMALSALNNRQQFLLFRSGLCWCLMQRVRKNSNELRKMCFSLMTTQIRSTNWKECSRNPQEDAGVRPGEMPNGPKSILAWLSRATGHRDTMWSCGGVSQYDKHKDIKISSKIKYII